MQPADGERPAPGPSLAPSLLPPLPAPALAPRTPSSHSTDLIEEFLDAQQAYELTPFALKNAFNSHNTFTSYLKTSTALHPSITSKDHFQSFIYPSLYPQNVKWSPFVQMTARCVASTTATSERMSKVKCRCAQCTNAHCLADGGRNDEQCDVGCSRFQDSYTNPDQERSKKEVPFKCNIASFCNQCTMTHEFQKADAACGICFGVDMAVAADAADCAAMGTPPEHCSRTQYSHGGPRPTLDSASAYCPLDWEMTYCPPLPCSRWYEPERDSGLEAAFACTTSIASATMTDDPVVKACSRRKMSPIPSEEEYHSNRRRMLYNEGISDDVFVKLDNCVNVGRRASWSQRNSRPEPDCVDRGESYIPHSHQTSSKYHEDCKKYPARPYRAPRRCSLTSPCPPAPAPMAADDHECPPSPGCRSPPCYRVARQTTPYCRSPPTHHHSPPPCNRAPPPCNRVPPPCNRAPPPCNRAPTPCNHAPSPCNRTSVSPARRKVITSERNIEDFLQTFIF